MSKYSIVSICLSIISIVGIVIHNMKLHELYLQAGRKEKALFGIIELQQLGDKLCLGACSLIGLILVVMAIKKKETTILVAIAALICVLSIVLLFLRLWIWWI